jgi:hypothetical protein
VIPPDANAAFVAAMEDVLEVYTRPHDPDFPVVCLDETSKQLIAETRVPIPVKPGHPARHDYEYERNGTANLFMMFAPLEGFRHVKVTDRHTALDYAQVLKELSDTHFPDAKKICLVQGRVEAWRAGLGRYSGSLLAHPFVCECPTISTMPRFQAPPRRTQHADFPHYAPPFASCQGLWTYPAGATFSRSRRTL